MNQQLENILISTLEKAQEVGGDIYSATKDGVTKAVDFAQTEIPQVIEEILRWELVYHSTCAIAGAVLTLTVLSLVLGLVRWGLKIAKEGSDPFEPFMAALVLGIIMIPVVIPVVIATRVPQHAMTATKIYVAPKVFFIDYCSDLIEAQRKQGYNRKHAH